MPFVKATKDQAKAKIGLYGPSGSGKTYTSLLLATVLAEGGKFAVIDTENKTASKYAGKFSFDTCGLTDFSPQSYVKAMSEAQALGYKVVVVDSLSHAWMGRGGVLEMVDRATAASRSKNTFTEGWRAATPEQNRLIEAILQCEAHLICTMRSKTEYVIDAGNGGRSTPRKVGMAPVQREGMEYELDIVGDMDMDHRLTVTKSRCEELAGRSFDKPDKEFGEAILRWLKDGDPVPDPHQQAIIELSDAITLSRNPSATEQAIMEREKVDAIIKIPTARAKIIAAILRDKAEARDEEPVQAPIGG